MLPYPELSGLSQEVCKMTPYEYRPPVGLYHRNPTPTQRLGKLDKDLQHIKRLLARVADRLAVRVD